MRARCETMPILKRSFIGLNSVFLLLNWLSYKGLRTQSALLLIYSQNSWIHAFLRGNVKTVLFLTIQFRMSLVCTHFKCKTVLFASLIGPSQMLSLQDRVDLGAMAMKGYSASPNLNCKQPRREFELRSSCPFLTSLTIAPSTSIYLL